MTYIFEDYLSQLHHGQWFNFNHKEHIYSNLTILDTQYTKPTEQECIDGVAALQLEYDSQEYARNRKREYDQLNQFEMQFDDDRDSTTTWVDTINEIKGRHPK